MSKIKTSRLDISHSTFKFFFSVFLSLNFVRLEGFNELLTKWLYSGLFTSVQEYVNMLVE